MAHVSEIFGFPPTNNSSIANKFRSSYNCPFRSDSKKLVECDPVNKGTNLTDESGNLLLSHQTGACSVLHKFRGEQTEAPVIICPYRFWERTDSNKIKVFEFIKNKFLTGKNVVFVPEVGLGEYGRADWMICEIDKNKKLLDYNHLEFQADATTATKELVMCVKDFFDGKDITTKDYGYGLNSKASIKGSSLQMIDKGFLFKKLNKKSFWVIQDTLFSILCKIYNIEMGDITNKPCPDEHTLIFIVVSLNKNSDGQKYILTVSKCFSTKAEDMQKAMSNKKPLEEESLLEELRAKINGGQFIG